MCNSITYSPWLQHCICLPNFERKAFVLSVNWAEQLLLAVVLLHLNIWKKSTANKSVSNRPIPSKPFIKVFFLLHDWKFFQFAAQPSQIRPQCVRHRRPLARKFELLAFLFRCRIKWWMYPNLTPCLNRLQLLITAAGKKFYSFVMGRLNEAKLCNFPEVLLIIIHIIIIIIMSIII